MVQLDPVWSAEVVVSLLEEIRAQQAEHRKGPRCSVCVLLSGMSKEDREDLEKAFADSSLYTSVISRALAKRDVNLKEHAVSRHRSGRCAG